MKTICTFRKIWCLAFLALVIVGCSNDDDVQLALPSLYEIAQQKPEISTFAAAIDAAGIRQSLEGQSTFTVLAPTNQAFQDFFIENGYSGVSAVPQAVLKQLLYNHLIGANIKKNQFNSGYMKTYATVSSANNNKISLLVEANNDVKFNGLSTIITPNLQARNGTLHVVDKFIAIPTIYDHIKNNPDLLTLKNALTRDLMSPSFIALSQSQGPLTVFAPRNDAFTAYLSEFSIPTLNTISDVQLEEILSYHIITSGNYLANTFINNQVLPTLEGQTLQITLTGGGTKVTDVNLRASTIFFADIQGSNGVIHAVDKVLKP